MPVTKVELCPFTLALAGECEGQSCWVRPTITAYVNTVPCEDRPIKHDPVCDADYDDRYRYSTRFGDVCCGECHTPLFWAPSLVRDGIYGDYTDQWIANRLAVAVS